MYDRAICGLFDLRPFTSQDIARLAANGAGRPAHVLHARREPALHDGEVADRQVPDSAPP